MEGFSKIVSVEEIKKENYSLNIKSYIFNKIHGTKSVGARDLKETITDWLRAKKDSSAEYNVLSELIKE